MQGLSDKFLSLFDFSFKKYITPSLISLIYSIAMVVIPMRTLYWVLFTAPNKTIAFILWVPLTLFYIVLTRVFLEAMSAIFRIASQDQENVVGTEVVQAVQPTAKPIKIRVEKQEEAE